MSHKEKQSNQKGPKTSSSKISRQKIGQRINELLDERESLFRALEGHNYRQVSALFASEDLYKSPELRNAIEEGLERIRNETEFLRPLDSLGIRVFVDDLENQPSDEELKIEFNSESVQRENMVDMRNIAGRASRFRGRIEVAGYKPPLQHQIAVFLDKGELHPSIQTLIHEMIHWIHYMRNTRNQINGVLTESHAYLAEVIGSRSRRGISDLHKTLTDPKGLYEFDETRTMKGLVNVVGLLAQGLSQEEIARLVANSCYDEKRHDFFPLKEKLNPGHFSSLELQALEDIYKLNLTNQRLKAQFLMYETLKSHFPMEKLKEFQMKDLRRRIAKPIYYKKGALVPSEELCQSIICPANAEWPYNSDGLRTGILFGYVENDDRQFEFALGKLSSTPKDSTFVPAKTSEEQERLLSLIREQAAEITKPDKSHLVNVWFAKYPTSSVLSSKILKAVLSRDEALSLAHEIKSNILGQIDMMWEGLETFDEEVYLPGQLREKVVSYTNVINRYQELFDLFEIGLAEISPDLAAEFNAIKKELARLREVYEKTDGPMMEPGQKAA